MSLHIPNATSLLKVERYQNKHQAEHALSVSAFRYKQAQKHPYVNIRYTQKEAWDRCGMKPVPHLLDMMGQRRTFVSSIVCNVRDSFSS
jgi:hypothetical protein